MACGCFLFPYEKIPKGSRIVIYGAGNVGTSYVRQMQQTGYCRVVAWVDKEYKKRKNRYFDVISVESISQLDYDYIVIAVAGPNLGLQIVRQLTSGKIDEDKIVFIDRRYFPYEEAEITLNDILNDRKCIYFLVEDFKKRYFREIDYFLSIYREINDNEDANGIRDRVFCEIKECLRESFDIETKEILIRILYLIRRFDKETMRIAVQTAKEQKKFTNKYWLLSNIGLLEFLYPDSVYNDFYTDKRELYMDVSKGIIDGRIIQKTNESPQKNIVILAQYLRGLEESLTKFVVMYANELAKTDYTVHIVLEEPFFYCYGEAEISPYGATNITSLFWKERIEEYLDDKVCVHYAKERSIKERYYHAICEVISINPRFVLDMCAKHSFLSAELYKHFPIVCVSTGHNCNAAIFHKYICRGKSLCVDLNQKYHSVDEDQMIELPVGTVFPEAIYEYRREDYGFDKDDFLIVIVGRRLGKDITDDLADEIIALLKKYTGIKLLLVGGETDIFARKSAELINNNQVISWGYEKDLPSLYRICDVFLNPDRIGAGWSITWAIGEGLPVISTDYPNDCTPLLGDLVVRGGYPEIINEIEKMYTDNDYYTEWKNRTKKRKEQCSFSKKIDKLIEVCEALEI